MLISVLQACYEVVEEHVWLCNSSGTVLLIRYLYFEYECVLRRTTVHDQIDEDERYGVECYPEFGYEHLLSAMLPGRVMGFSPMGTSRTFSVVTCDLKSCLQLVVIRM